MLKQDVNVYFVQDNTVLAHLDGTEVVELFEAKFSDAWREWEKLIFKIRQFVQKWVDFAFCMQKTSKWIVLGVSTVEEELQIWDIWRIEYIQ